MRLRSVGFAAFAAVALVQSCQPACTPPPPGPPARPTDEVVGLVVEGTGNGHGRGLSQWGAFGWAVEYGRSFDQILAHYYGGTTLGGVAMNTPIRIRLTGADDASIIGVISTNGTAMWNGVGYSALEVLETGPNQYNVYGAWTPTCPGSDVPLMLLAGGIRGPVTLTTAVDETTAGAGDVLGVCQPDGSVTHYRGSISVLNDANGANRTVNEVGINNYLRGVIPKEVPSSWGNAGGGAGMHALYAQAVAARSFGITQGRYGYAGTCDTSSCQVYGGAARRPGPTAPLSLPGTQVCEPGNVTFECATTNAAVADTGGWVMVWPDGRIVSTEFSSSNGPRTAGGAFPAVDDPGDAVAANPNHRWTRIIDANAVEARYGLGSLRSATTERDPASPYDGIWGNRVRLQGTAGTVLVSAWDFRNAFGLPSPGYTISAVTRELSMNAGFTFIGDSVGASLTEELPALLDGMFSEPRYDSVGGRCTAAPGCSSTGLAAAQAVPAGTTLVFVELGLNDGSNFASKLDQVMQVLRAKGVRHVVWLNVQTRSGNPAYDVTNQALWDARARWPELVVVDWNTISAGNANNQDRWFTTDRIHMTATGQAELARVVRNHVLWFARV